MDMSSLLVSYLGALRRQIVVILFFAVIGIALGVSALFFIKPDFGATATLLIDTRKYENSSKSDVIGRVTYDSNAAVDSQIEILKSQDVALSVVNALQLASDPEFTATGAGIRATLFGWLSPAGGAISAEEKIARATAYFSKHLTVKRVGDTFAIDVGFESKYADRAAQVANAASQAYIKQQLDGQDKAIRQASDWLEGRIQELGAKSAAGQRAVVEFKANNNLLDLGGGRQAEKQRLSDLSERLDAARARETDARVKLSQWDAITNSPQSDPGLHASISGITDDALIPKLREQYAELANRYQDLSAKLDPKHQAFIDLRAQMEQIRSALVNEMKMVRVSLQNDYSLQHQRAEGISGELADAIAKSHTADMAQVTLRELEVTAQTYQGLYDTFLQHYTDALQQQNSPIAQASIITPATPPVVRNYKKFLILVAALPLTAIAIGVGIGLLREFMNRVFWTSQSVEAALQLPCLAIVPSVTQDLLPSRKKRTSDRPAIERAGDKQFVARERRNLAWLAVDLPLSRFAEAFRGLKVAVNQSAGASKKVIGITSALSNEGKSTVALAFSLLAARGGAKVLLVDGDLRNPTLSESLAPKAELGIWHIIERQQSSVAAIWKDPATNLEFLPAGVHLELANSADLLGSPEMKVLFDRLRESYDLIVVDLSPLAPIVDASATIDFVDYYFHVVEWGRTRKDIVVHSLRSAPQIYDATLGIILTKVDFRRLARYNSHLEGYYINKNHLRYGISAS